MFNGNQWTGFCIKETQLSNGLTREFSWIDKSMEMMIIMYYFGVSLREKCPSTEFFLARIFPHSDWIQRDTKYLSVFNPNAGKYGLEKTLYLDTFHAACAWARKKHWFGFCSGKSRAQLLEIWNLKILWKRFRLGSQIWLLQLNKSTEMHYFKYIKSSKEN